MKVNKLLTLFFVFWILIGCNSSSEEVKMVSTNGVWSKKQSLEIPFEIKDSNPKNIIFVLRNNNDYPYSNVRFFVDLKDGKNKLIKTDTLNCIIAKPTGEWIGSGFGDIKEVEFMYKSDFKFPQLGKYKVSIKQAMRVDKLKGIEDIGLKLVTVKP